MCASCLPRRAKSLESYPDTVLLPFPPFPRAPSQQICLCCSTNNLCPVGPQGCPGCAAPHHDRVKRAPPGSGRLASRAPRPRFEELDQSRKGTAWSSFFPCSCRPSVLCSHSSSRESSPGGLGRGGLSHSGVSMPVRPFRRRGNTPAALP